MWRVLIAGHSGVIDCNFYYYFNMNDVTILMLYSYLSAKGVTCLRFSAIREDT